LTEGASPPIGFVTLRSQSSFRRTLEAISCCTRGILTFERE
jgi:hypothetical protein